MAIVNGTTALPCFTGSFWSSSVKFGSSALCTAKIIIEHTTFDVELWRLQRRRCSAIDSQRSTVALVLFISCYPYITIISLWKGSGAQIMTNPLLGKRATRSFSRCTKCSQTHHKTSMKCHPADILSSQLQESEFRLFPRKIFDTKVSCIRSMNKTPRWRYKTWKRSERKVAKRRKKDAFL